MASILRDLVTLVVCFQIVTALSNDGNYDIKVKVVKPKKNFESMIAGFSSVRSVLQFSLVLMTYKFSALLRDVKIDCS